MGWESAVTLIAGMIALAAYWWLDERDKKKKQ